MEILTAETFCWTPIPVRVVTCASIVIAEEPRSTIAIGVAGIVVSWTYVVAASIDAAATWRVVVRSAAIWKVTLRSDRLDASD